MIKFFRKIRLQLLTENKTGKPAFAAGRYLKYALGEIILVVFGILIALQINNWNENRKAQIIKQMLLQELQQEFQGNLKDLQDHEEEITKSNDYLIKVLNYSAGKEKGMTSDSLRIYSSKMFYIQNLPITKSSLDGIIASGKISLFDSELTSLLTGFEADFNSFNDISKILGERFASKTSNDLLLNLAYYQPFHKILYPDKSLEIHPNFKKNDEDFENYIKDPYTYSIINELYVYELASKAWTSHLKGTVKSIITNIEANQSNK